MLSWEDFEKLDIRVGTVLTAVPFPQARKPAYQLTVDFGALGIKKTSAQITALYQPEDVIGKQVTAVVNFPPKQIANFISECLLMGVYNTSGDVVLLQTERPVENGMKVG